MSGARFSRRAFVIGGGLGALAAACSSGDDKEAASAGSSTTAAAEAGHHVHDEPTGEQPLAGSLANSDLYVGGEQRFAFGVLRLLEDKTYELVRDETVLVAFAPPEGGAGTPQTTTFHGEGLPADRGLYVTRAAFDAPGFWEATISAGELTGTLPFEVYETNRVPTSGDDAIPVTTPTTDDKAGVDPICTRNPPCPFHEVSLDDALAGDLPVMLMFSTPAYCISRVCGPVLDLLIEMATEFEGQAAFVHAEIYKDRNARDLSPAMERWGLETEPWAFGIDPAGQIVGRLDGAFDLGELRDLVTATVGAPVSAG